VTRLRARAAVAAQGPPAAAVLRVLPQAVAVPPRLVPADAARVLPAAQAVLPVLPQAAAMPLSPQAPDAG